MIFYSHPDKLLVDHLLEVCDKGINKVSNELKRPFKIAALCHDFGKYTTFFQNYLNNNRRSELSNHGFISAIFAAFVSIKEFGEDSYLSLIVYNIVLHHHGNLESFSTNLPTRFKRIAMTDFPINLLNKIDIGEKQIGNIKENKNYLINDFKLIGLSDELDKFLDNDKVILEVLQKLKKLESKLSFTLNKDNLYFYHQEIYSALISSDKICASRIVYESPLYSSYQEIVEIKKKRFQDDSKQINKIREGIFLNVINNLEKNYNKANIFSITAPTGTGKTYTGFFAATRLRELLGLTGKIIYSLPFTSIIDQNYKAIVDILNSIEPYKTNKGRYIIKHHNLSKTDYKTEYHDYSGVQSELLIENWESGIVVTTFVQLFETIIGTRNRMLKKFNSLNDSVILIDELQSIDIKYYNLIEYALEKLCEYTNCRIIIMTATKPMILESSLELLPNNEDYFRHFNRTKLIPKLDRINISDFIDSFNDDLQDKSYLVVCNTINQSIEIYNELKKLDRDIYYLSTNILPFKRKERIEEIGIRLKNNEKIILISTQVIEAGVDLDFDEVIRDLAPLDSIIQCAGRCNRNSSKNQGKVRVINLVNEVGDSYGKYIYGNTLLNITRELLSEKDYFMEEDYFELINKYYSSVKKEKSEKESEEFIRSINNLNFSENEWSLNKFSLIKNNPDYIDVLFLYDDVAVKYYEEYKEALKLKSFEEKSEKYLEIGQVLKNYTLSIPIKYCRSFVPEFGMLVLPIEGIEQFYDDDTGFIRKDADTYMIF